ncbi:MAG TPA: prepilin-type N-terminal cleavage/methylation domain-containing protein [Caulobacteraceae bacterium]
MNDDGYTLAEMLAALAILGLAFGGLTQGARVIGQLQTKAAATARTTADDRRAQAALESLMARRGPFTSDGRGAFQGTASGFTFDCEAGRCGVEVVKAQDRAWLVIHQGGQQQRIVLSAPNAAFAYVDATGSSPIWPNAQARPTALTTVLLQGAGPGGSRPLAAARVWVEEPANCVFDAIAQGCRA